MDENHAGDAISAAKENNNIAVMMASMAVGCVVGQNIAGAMGGTMSGVNPVAPMRLRRPL